MERLVRGHKHFSLPPGGHPRSMGLVKHLAQSLLRQLHSRCKAKLQVVLYCYHISYTVNGNWRVALHLGGAGCYSDFTTRNELVCYATGIPQQ